MTADEVAEELYWLRSHGKGRDVSMPNWAVPAARALQLPARELEVDPWVLGVANNYLRDGELRIYEEHLKIHLERFAAAGFELDRLHPPELTGEKFRVHTCRSEKLNETLKAMGWSWGRIPPEYLRASAEQRMRLLVGHMDQHKPRYPSKGRVGLTFTCKATTPLSRQVQELVRSLGWPAKLQEKIDPGRNNLGYVTWFPETLPVTFPKLIARYSWLTRWKGHDLERYIQKFAGAELTGAHLVREIEVDSRFGLFVAGEMFMPVGGGAR